MTTTAGRSSLGQIRIDGDQATLIFERRFHHPIEKVWRTITDPAVVTKWYFPEAKIEPRTGGRVKFSYSEKYGAGLVTGKVLIWDPPRVFEHEWIVVSRQGSQNGEFGAIRWELESDGINETILKLTHRNLPGPIAKNFAPGIHTILDLLECFLNEEPLPDWMKLSQKLRSKYSNRPSLL